MYRRKRADEGVATLLLPACPSIRRLAGPPVGFDHRQILTATSKLNQVLTESPDSGHRLNNC